MEPKPAIPKPQPSRAWRIARFFLCSIAGGSLLGIALVAVIMLYAAIVYKDRFVVGGGPDPAGVFVLFTIVYGGLGMAAGAVVGLVGGVVIALRR